MRPWDIKAPDNLQRTLAKRAHLVIGYRCLADYLQGMAIIMSDQPGDVVTEDEPLLQAASPIIKSVTENDAFDFSRLVGSLGQETRRTIYACLGRAISYHEETWAVTLADEVIEWSNKAGTRLSEELLLIAYCHRTIRLVAHLSSIPSDGWDDRQDAIDALQHGHISALGDRAREGWQKRHERLAPLSQDDLEAYESYIDALCDSFLEHWQFVQESLAATLYWAYYPRLARKGGIARSA